MYAIVISLFIITLTVAIVTVIMTSGRKNTDQSSNNKNKSVILRNASKKLAQNPNDIESLLAVGDIYFQDQDWEKAYSSYHLLINQLRHRPPSEQFEVSIRYGTSALKTDRVEEAKQGFLLAKNINPNYFEVNYNLGYVYYIQKEYEKALLFLKKSLAAQSDNIMAMQYLGLTLQQLRKYKDALPLLRRVLEVQPDNKDILFTMSECFYEIGSNDQALKIFKHLRLDQTVGPRSALYAGMIRLRANELDQAIENFQIGLKHERKSIEITNELRYYLAQAYIRKQDLQKALQMLNEIQTANPGYKDVTSLIMQYKELNQNKNLHIYLMANQNEFVGLCRKIVSRFFARAKVKIMDITAVATYTDIVAEINTSKWADLVVFRFYRSQGSVGELTLRDLHERIKELKAGKGICMTAGLFTEESRRFSEGRPIDLFDKTRLNKVLNAVH